MLLNNLFVFSQNNAINRFTSVPIDIDHKDCVKSLVIKNYSFDKDKETIDTAAANSKTIAASSKIDFSEKGIIIKQSYYGKSINDIRQIIEHDKLGRIKTILRKNDDKLSIFAEQFFNNTTEYPDSLNIYWNGTNKDEQYINHFSKKLLVKQEFYRQDTLRTYNSYAYDKKSRLTKDSFYNTINGFGITIGKSITGDEDEKDLYPNDSTMYYYDMHNDTIIKIRDRMSYSLKDITKKFESKNFSLEIQDEYDRNYLEKSTYIYKSKDSISKIIYYYINKKEISSYYKTFTTPKSIISIWKSDGFYNNSEKSETTIIETEYDIFNNWIRKTYSRNNIITGLIEREIEYYCH